MKAIISTIALTLMLALPAHAADDTEIIDQPWRYSKSSDPMNDIVVHSAYPWGEFENLMLRCYEQTGNMEIVIGFDVYLNLNETQEFKYRFDKGEVYYGEGSVHKNDIYTPIGDKWLFNKFKQSDEFIARDPDQHRTLIVDISDAGEKVMKVYNACNK